MFCFPPQVGLQGHGGCIRLGICLTFLLLTTTALWPRAVWSQGQSQAVATYGHSAPDGNGWYAGFYEPSLNNNGDVAFAAYLLGTSGGASDSRGIFLKSGNVISQIAREDDDSPDGNGVFSNLPTSFVMNSSGSIMFSASLSGTSGGNADNSGIFLTTAGTTSQIAREGHTAPGGNGNYSTFFSSSLQNSGTVLYGATLSGSTGGTTDDQAVYQYNGGTTTELLRKGATAPGGNGTYLNLAPSNRSNSGKFAFSAFLGGTSGGILDDHGIFLFDNGSISEIAREGNAAPDGNGEFLSFGPHKMSDSGILVTKAQLRFTSGGTTDRQGIYSSAGNTLTKIARDGELAPDGNGSFVNIGNHGIEINDSGSVAFHSVLAGTSGGSNDDRGIFLANGGTVMQIARAGESAPDDNGSFEEFNRLTLNNAGAAAFQADLTSPAGGSSDDSGIYIGDGIDLIEVVREGMFMNGSVVTSISFSKSGFNDAGQVAYAARMSNHRDILRLFTPDLHWRDGFGGNWDDAVHWTLGIRPAAVHDVYIDSATNFTISGPANNQAVRNFQLGGGAGSPTLDWNSGVELTADSISIESGVLTGGGTFLANNVSVAPAGTIQIQNSAMTFNTPQMNNAGLVTSHDSSMLVDGNLNNTGQMNFAGESSLLVTGNLHQEGGLFLDSSIATVEGIYHGEGEFTGNGILNVLGTLSPGNSAAAILMDGILNLGSNATFEIELGGTGQGAFDQIYGMDEFNIDGDLSVSLINGFQLTGGMEFLIADVEGVSFGQFAGLEEGDSVGFFGGQELFISYQRGGGFGVALFAVPEPGGLALIGLMGLAAAFTHRRKRRSASDSHN